VLVDRLEQHGVLTIDVKKLQEAGSYTVEEADRDQGSDQAEGGQDIAKGDTIAAADLTMATEMHLKWSQIIQVLYDIQNSITELFGRFRTGQSQLCHTIAVTCQLPKYGNGHHLGCVPQNVLSLVFRSTSLLRPKQFAP
jgi:DNA repair protein RAD51